MFFTEEEQKQYADSIYVLSDLFDEFAKDFNIQVVKHREKIDKLNNSYVMLTFIGFIPSAISCLSSFNDVLVPFILILCIMFLNISYILLYICIYFGVLRYFGLQIDKIDDQEERDLLLGLVCAPDPEDSHMTKDEILEKVNNYFKVAQNVLYFKQYLYYVIFNFKFVTYIVQFLVSILCVTVIVLLAISSKNDDYGLPDIAQLIITISIFVMNILLSLIHVYKL